MNKGLGILLVIAILFGSGYWYYTANAVCDVPIAYRVGSINPDFDITREEARNAISVAESVWEDATGRNLFTYDAGAAFSINFVFDDRQAYTEAERDLRGELDNREDKSDTVREQYEYLLEEYGTLKDAYGEQTAQYEVRLEAHNKEVQRWNTAGGAPEDVFNNLSVRQKELSEEQKELNTVAYQLNQLVRQMNSISAEGNSLISDYNEVVEEYNTTYSEEREFTQGDYQGDFINIYQFDSIEELGIVLAHEFGHALSITHVEGENSFMYHLMGKQSLDDGLTLFDVAEFENICGDSGFTLWGIL